MREIGVHIGLPKAASTSLQQGLFARHSEIEFLGKRAGARAFESDRRCASDAALRLGDQLFWTHALAIDAARARHVFDREILAAQTQGRLPVYSYEGLAVASLPRREAVARNLSKVFASCKVVIGLRRPTDFVEALYFQHLKRRHLGARSSRLDFRQSLAPEAWLGAVVRGEAMADHLDYARTIRIFVDALGRESVQVFALEQWQAAPSTFAERLCAFLEIDAEEGGRLLAGRRDNRRLTESVYRRMRAFERPGLRSLAYGMSGRRLRKRWLGVDRADGEGRARLALSSPVRQAIDDRTRVGNRWIAGEWGLSLEDYGYPV